MDLLEKMKKAQETKILVTGLKPKAEKPKEPKKKKIGISERKMDKNQTLDAIYSLGKENIGYITDVKLRSILEDIKVYSQRK